MKLTVLFLTAGILNVCAKGLSQNVSFSGEKVPLKTVLLSVEKQTGFLFLYPEPVLQTAKPVSISVRDLPLGQFLSQIFKTQPLKYTIKGKSVFVSLKSESPSEPRVNEAFKPLMDTLITVTGKVVDEKGEPLGGANIVVKGTKSGTTTNANGVFALKEVNDDAVIIISSIGYETREVNVTGKVLSDIALKNSTSPLDEVQVTAYGTTTKRFNAGNITTISAKEIAKNPVNNVLEALQGKVPGLFIQQVTGQPGGAFSVRLRGSANLTTGATQPLVIVDGVRFPAGTLPLSSNTLYGTQNFLQGGSGLNYINPNDIERVDVLKDVDATAIYGSSGAYGVILITTKKARSTAQSFNANIYTGVSVLGRVPDMLNLEEYLMLRREALKNDGLQPGAGDLDLNGTWPEDRYTNWRKEFIGKSAATTNANLSYSGGSQNTVYLISGSFRNTGNIQLHKGKNQDGSLRFALNTGSPDNKFNISLTGTYLASKNTMVPHDFSSFAATVPNAPRPFNEDGSINWEAIGTNVNSSQGASNINKTYENATNNLMANATLVYRPVKKVTLRTVFGYNTLSGKELIGYPTSTMNPADAQAPQKTVSILRQYTNRSITVSPYGEYNTAVAQKGNLSIKLGGEVNNQVSFFDNIQGTGFPADALLRNPSVATSVVTTYNLTEYRSIGMYGILKFIWNNKYIADINLRRDGSTKFGPGRRIGNFGSGALAWLFSEEKLVQNNLPWLSFGKLRASSGVVGGDAIPDFNYLEIYSSLTGTYDGKVGLAPTTLPNPYLNWERNFNSEVALELGFLEDRIMVDFSYYHNRAGNQLLGQPLSSVTGFTSYSLNSDALIRTSGYELVLNTANIKSGNFTWSTQFNISLPGSKLLKLPTQSNQNSNYVLNKPVTGVLVYKYNGVNPETGNFSFTNAKGVTDDFTTSFTQADKTEFIDLAPKFFGGLTNSFTYKQFTLDFTFNYLSRKGKNMLGQQLVAFGLFGANSGDFWLQRWQQPGDVTDVPKVTTSFLESFQRFTIFQGSEGSYSDASYIRLQNLSLRYNLSPEMNRKLRLKGLQVYLQGQNLLTISGFDGVDPENLSPTVIPPLRVVTAGINITL